MNLRAIEEKWIWDRFWKDYALIIYSLSIITYVYSFYFALKPEDYEK